MAAIFLATSISSTSAQYRSRMIDSEVCAARRFCTAERAAQRLELDLGLTPDQAKNVTDFTHNSSGIVWNSCSCSADCSLTSNCCEDSIGNRADVREAIPTHLVKMTATCQRSNWKTVSSVDSCPSPLPEGTAESVRDKCVEGSSETHMLAQVTSTKSYVTYSNVYCAMCNGESISDVLPWNFKFSCLEVSQFAPSLTPGNKSLSDIGSDNQCKVDTSAPQTPPPPLADKIVSVYGALLTEASYTRICDVFNGVISSCPDDADGMESGRCMIGPTSYVTTSTHPTVVFKNSDCAACHGINKDELMCQVCHPSKGCIKGSEKTNDLLPRFSILVQPYPSEEMACRVEGENSKCKGALADIPSCNFGEYLDTESVSCVPLCPFGTVLFKGICVMRGGLGPSNCNETVSYEKFMKIGRRHSYHTSMFNNNVFYLELDSGSTICHTCTRAARVMYNEDLRIYPNGSVEINSTMVDRLFVSRDGNATYLCPPTGNNRKNNPDKKENLVSAKYQDILTLVLCFVSIFFLLLFFIAFSLVKRMRNIPGTTIAGNMLMFLLAYVMFLLRNINEVYPDATGCYVMSVLVNYFFLAAFVFMILYAVLIIRSLEFVDLDSRYTPLTVAKIWMAGIFLPFIVIIPALLMDTLYEDSPWSPGYGGKECFMSNRGGNIMFFTVPIAVCLCITIIIYGIVVHRLRQIAAATRRVRDSHKEKIYLCMKLIVVLGFNWLSAIVAASVDRKTYPVANEIVSTIFIVLCCLHGFFGFIVFVVSGSNIQMLKARYNKLSETHSTSGGKATRTYSAQAPTSTAASELSTMIHKPVTAKESSDHVHDINNHNGYSSTHDTLEPGADDSKSNGSPISNRSSSSKHKCDFF